MKEFKYSFSSRIRNVVKKQPKVLLWTLWRSGTHWVTGMLSDMMGIPAIYCSVDGSDYKQEMNSEV